MKDENKTNTLLLTIIGVATLLVAVIGATFAYFTANVMGQESSTTINIGAGTLSIVYANGSGNLTAEGIIPKEADQYGDIAPAIEKTFTITGNNTTNSVMPYTISIVVQTNDFTDGALTWTLSSENTGANGVVATAVSTMTAIASGNSTITLGSGYFTGAVSSKVHTYQLNIYFPDTGVVQDIDKNKTFTGYVNIVVGSVYTTST